MCRSLMVYFGPVLVLSVRVQLGTSRHFTLVTSVREGRCDEGGKFHFYESNLTEPNIGRPRVMQFEMQKTGLCKRK